jgi:YggT family protein
MLTQIFQFLLETVFGFMVFLLLSRFYMQFARVSFRNPIGQFVTTLSNWIVMPARRVIPGLFGLDMASLTCAWLMQAVLVALTLYLRGLAIDSGTDLLVIFAIGFADLLRAAIQLLIGLIIVQVVISWVNPHAPLAPLFNGLTRPFLAPLQRVLPLIGNIDLSPLVFVVLAQIAIIVIAGLSQPLYRLL